MPAKSKAQFKFMKAVASGEIKKPGLSPVKAAEYTSSNVGRTAYKNLVKKKIAKKMKSDWG